MTEKKQLNKQALYFSLIILLSWLIFSPFLIIPEIVDFCTGVIKTFKNMIFWQLIGVILVMILIAVTLILNYLLKPDLSRYFKIHIRFGIITHLICIVLLICFSVLSAGDGTIFKNRILLYIMNLYWVVPVILFLVEVGYYIKQCLYQKPREFIVLLVSNAGISVLVNYIAELFIIGSNI